MKKQTVPMFLFWAGLAFALELVANMMWLHNRPGFWGYLIMALLQALPYLLHNVCVKNGIWEGPKLIIIVVLVIYGAIFLKNWIFGAIRLVKLVQHLMLRASYQLLLLYCTKNFG